MNRYDLEESLVTVGGASSMVPQSVDDFARKLVGGHYLIAFALLIILILIVLWISWKHSETFNPTATLRLTQRDGLGETMDGGADRSSSAFAQQVQTGTGLVKATDPKAAINQPGSTGWQILNSKDFDCANREPSNSDAWSWMNGVAHEEFSGSNKPKTDNDFSKLLAGRA